MTKARTNGESSPLKPSKYNLISPQDDGTRLAFNASTAALLEIDAETFPVIERILREPDSELSPREEELRRSLIEGRYLVPAAEDEPGRLRARSREHRVSNPVFLLTIAPTLSCNLDCDYCFQRHEKGRMTPETEKALLDFCERRLRESRGLMVTWFGGEPTLCLPIIERLQAALAEMALRHGVAVEPSSIVTNGYLLDREVASRLAAAGVAAAQVTLDGPEQVHDRRRKLRGGRGTFRTIIENLKASAEFLRISIRVNVDRQNIDSAEEVVDVLGREGLLPSVQIFFAPVNQSDGACADMTGRCYSREEFARSQIRLYERLVRKGFHQIDYPDLASGGICGADTENGFVVGPNGLLFKCWEDISIAGERSTGTVFSDARAPHQQRNLDRYRSWDPFEKPGCVSCEILPLCMGGCPLQGLKRNDADHGLCSPWKYNLIDMLRLRRECEPDKEVRA